MSKVLVVEGGTTPWTSIRDALERHGASFRRVTSFARVAHVAKAYSPDLVLLDCEGRKLECRRALRVLKAAAFKHHLSVIVLGGGDFAEAGPWLTHGADAFLNRPFCSYDVQELLKAFQVPA